MYSAYVNFGMSCAKDDNYIRSPYDDGEHKVPDVPIMTYVFGRLREGLKTWPEDKAWIVRHENMNYLRGLVLIVK
jgi:hypothetical protein